MRMLRSRFLDTWQPRVLCHVASRRAQSCYRYVETSLHCRLTVMHGQQRRVDVDDKTILLACTLPYTHRVRQRADTLSMISTTLRIGLLKKQTDAHKADREFLETALTDIRATKPQSRVLIATYYAPLCGPAVQPKHRDSPLNGFFFAATFWIIC